MAKYDWKVEKSIKENKLVTLQDAWDNDDKELFLSMIDWLEINRKITSKEAKDLEEIYDNWEEYKEENPNAKIKFGNLVAKIKESKKSIKESEYDDYVNLDNLHFGYNDEYGFMEFRFYKNIQIKYGNGYTIIFGQLPSKEWAFAITDVSKGEGNLIDSRVNFVKKDTLADLNNALKNLGIDKTWNELSESKKSARESLKESFEYEGVIPLEELMNILDDEWKYSRGGLFGESSHWDDEPRDEDRYIEISAIADFTAPISTGYSFANKKIDNEYYKEVNKVWKDVDGDDKKYFDVLNECDPILFVLTIDLKELLVYADIDLGNELGSTEVARERLADNEKDFRKQIQRMIDAF